MTSQAIQITSLAAMRRAVAIPGVVIRVVAHWQPHLRDTTRTPCKVQTNGYAYMGICRDGKECKMWCHYPYTVKQLQFNDDGTVTFYPFFARSWTFAFEQPA